MAAAGEGIECDDVGSGGGRSHVAGHQTSSPVSTNTAHTTINHLMFKFNALTYEILSPINLQLTLFTCEPVVAGLPWSRC